jgi:hypothetical protein
MNKIPLKENVNIISNPETIIIPDVEDNNNIIKKKPKHNNTR